MIPENVIYKKEELDKIYEENKTYLTGVPKDVFNQALIASELHFRHEVANALHARNLMKAVIQDLKEQTKELREESTRLKEEHAKLIAKHKELMEKLKAKKSA